MSSWPALLAAPSLLLGLPSGASECMGCHSTSRMSPPSRFSFGVGKWSEMQCYGCHHEMADIGRNLLGKGEDTRAFGLPYSFSAMKRFAQGHGPFLNAPLEPEWKVGGFERIDAARVRTFIAHPPVRSNGSSMIPFPLEKKPPQPAPSGRDAKRGERIFVNKCAGCYADSEGMAKRGPLHLALFTAKWLSAYAEAKVSSSEQRAMPKVALSLTEARSVQSYLELHRQLHYLLNTASREA